MQRMDERSNENDKWHRSQPIVVLYMVDVASLQVGRLDDCELFPHAFGGAGH